MADLATLKARLEQAEEALHKMATGTMEVSVEIAGQGRVQYAVYDAGIERLEKYIAQIKSEIARLEGRAPRRIIRVSF